MSDQPMSAKTCGWTGALGLLFCILLLGATWEPLLQTAQLNAISVWSGRGWAHVLVHASLAHLAVNLAGVLGLLLLWPELGRQPKVWAGVWGVYGLLAPLTVSAPAYGMSGLLHGIFAFAVMAWPFRARTPHEARGAQALLLLGLALKLLAEALQWVDVRGIAWRLHVAGAATGLALGACYILSRFRAEMYKNRVLHVIRSLR